MGQLLKDGIYDHYIVGIFQKVFTPKNELSLRMLSLNAEHCIRLLSIRHGADMHF